MKTILIFPFNLLSHYLRCLVLADSYPKDEYSIFFLSSDKYDHFIINHGYKTFSCRQFESDYVMACAKNFDFSWLGLNELESILNSQMSVINEFKADIVIGDVAPTLKMAAELTHVNHISLMNGYMTRHYAFTRKVPKTHKAFKYLNILPEVLSDKITDLAEKRALRKIHEPFKSLRRKYGLQELADYSFENEGNDNLICDLPSLFPQKLLPANYNYTGPLIYKYQDTEADWLEEISLEKPVICVSMGSSGEWSRLSFLNDSYYAKYTIIAAGDYKKVLHGTHILSKDFVNLQNVLSKAALLICHGGNGTIYLGILSNVYMLCLSSHFEQEWNIKAVEKNNFGKSADGFNERNWKHHINQAIKLKYEYKNTTETGTELYS